MARNYAALPHDYIEEMADLSDAEFGRLIRTLLIYSKTGREETLSGGERYLWRRVRNQEDRFQESYDSASNAKSEAGKKGAAKRWQRVADNGNAWQGMAEDSKNSYTETETNTETNIQPSIDGMNDNGQACAESNLDARVCLGGELGKGVVLLSEAQMNDLLDKLTLDEFNRYVAAVAEEELKGHHYRKRSHYQAILDMAMKDRRVG